ncbi:hypothetical protein RclHR1_17730005 [Rhizophagus clarus]|uniref:DDE-type integrase/transposase/recombinase n=1 Tax=Rhizophagus clarus TaxID=94130 RepID=A0A2Z6RDV9_9GLOM|nr:hypothetical protein RclHR1_17730005 [Rhizophagus clarus]GES96233.1 DDE-type integrase/transposase/recombinase [Rhizophagus clarus]
MTPLERYYKFYNLSGVPVRLLKDQEHYNIYQKPLKEKRSERSKVIVWKENAIQQSDLAEMPIDSKRYYYFLIVVEISRRRVDAKPIKNKFTNSIIKAFIKIYGRDHIQPPIHRLETDSGSEFTNSQLHDFFLNSIGIMMRFGEPERHKQQSYAERAIQAIEEPLLRRMTAQELKTGKTLVEWSKDFHDIVRLVDKQWQRDLPKIPEGLPKIDKNTELLLEGTQVQTKLLKPISVLGKKIHGKFRTGDIKWNPKVHIIKKLIFSSEQPPTYLLDGPHGRLGVSRCTYTKKELQVIPINEKPLFDSVIRGQPERYVPEKIFKHYTRKGQLQYLVKWERYPEDKSTWEPADRLQEDVPNLVRIYNDTK